MSIRKRPTRPTKPATEPVRPKAVSPSQPTKRRVFLVDDHPTTREGLAAIINRQVDLEVCCQACSPAEVIPTLAQLKADLMVTDMAMPGRSGIEFIKDVHALLPDLPLLVFSMHDEMLHAERALRAGARGYLMKDAGSAKVLEVIRLVLSGQSYVSPQMTARIVDAVTGRQPRGSSSPIEKLSDREFEVFRLLGIGKPTKEIAQALNLSPRTVDVYRGRIKAKLELRDATSLLRHAVRWIEMHEGQS